MSKELKIRDNELREVKHGGFNEPRKSKRDYRKVISEKQEVAIAKALGGRVTKGSKHGDVETTTNSGQHELLIEAKTVIGNKEIKIKREYLEKIAREASVKGKEPAFVFGFSEPILGTSQYWLAIPISFASEVLFKDKL